MEQGGSFFHNGQPQNSSSISNPLQGEEGNSSNAENQNQVVQAPPAAEARAQSINLPTTCVLRLMRPVLPHHTKITEESKETMVECVTEFISFITGEANEQCQTERRKTVMAEDVIYAMGKLGFDKYAELLTVYLLRYRLLQDTTPTRCHVGYQHPAPPIVPGFPVPMLSPFQGPMGMNGLLTDGLLNDGPSADGSNAGGSSTASNVYHEPFHDLFGDNNYSGN